jgi:hypothetical protein
MVKMMMIMMMTMMMMSVYLSLPSKVYVHFRKGFCPPYLILERMKTVNADDCDDSLIFWKNLLKRLVSI